jgi:hypothetical protein
MRIPYTAGIFYLIDISVHRIYKDKLIVLTPPLPDIKIVGFRYVFKGQQII